jgi:hypothetical protein
MPHPCPHHCPPERGGRGLAALAAIIALVIAAAAARPAVRAAETALQVAAITIGAVLALAALGAVAWVAVAVRRHELERRQAWPATIAGRVAHQLQDWQAEAIEPPRRVYGTPIHGQPRLSERGAVRPPGTVAGHGAEHGELY